MLRVAALLLVASCWGSSQTPAPAPVPVEPNEFVKAAPDAAPSEEPVALPELQGEVQGSVHGSRLDPPRPSPRPALVRGSLVVTPAPALKAAALQAGHTKLVVTAKLCIDIAGAVSRVDVMKSSGYPDYDALIIQQMQGWVYEPYVVDGTPQPTCMPVASIWRL